MRISGLLQKHKVEHLLSVVVDGGMSSECESLVPIKFYRRYFVNLCLRRKVVRPIL